MTKAKLSLLTLLCGLVDAACSSSSASSTKVAGDEDPIAAAVQAVAGGGALQGVVADAITATGADYDPGQAELPDDTHGVSTYSVNIVHDFKNNRVRQEWNTALLDPGPTLGPLRYVEIVDGTTNKGFLDGKHGFLPSLWPSVPMFNGRIGAVLKEARLTSPLRLLQIATSYPGVVQSNPDETYNSQLHHVVTLTDRPQPLRMFIDASTHLISKVDTVEDDPLLGDSLVEVAFGDWRRVDAVQMPFKLTVSVRGNVVRTEQRVDIHSNPAIAGDAFAIPAPSSTQRAYPQGPDSLAKGERASQWFLEGRAYGGPLDFDYAAVVPEVANLDRTVATGVYLVGQVSHNSVVIEMADYLIVAEAPLNEDAAGAVLAKIQAKWPNKPVRYVVNTHFHTDHAGGLRAYGAVGATIVTSNYNQEYFSQAMTSPHTINPDPLQVNPRDVPILTVSDKTVLTDGSRKVEVYAVDDLHVQGTLLVYLPAEKILFSSDLLSPGAWDPNVTAPDPAYPYPPGPFEQNALYLLSVLLPQLGIAPQVFIGGHGTVATLAQVRQSVM